jgi:aspartate aminotransferase
MPDISAKGKAMPDSPIRKLAPFANAAKERGTHVIHLNIGQPDIATPEVAMDAVRNLDRTVLEYSPSEGFARYRERLAGYYNGVGVDVTADEVLVTTGGSEALVFAFMSCLDAGDEVIIPEPFYANYNGFATLAGINIVPVTARIENGFSLPPMEEFERAITDRTKAILICNPGNPTGTKYPDSALEALAALVQEKDLFLFADEVYREFTYDGSNARSILTVPGLEQHAVVIDSVSKRYSMCGARIGALVTRNQEVRRTAMKFAMARLSPPTLAQIAAEAALDTPDSYFNRVRSSYRNRRDALVDGLAAIEGVTCPKPGGAFYAVAKLPIDDADAFCQWMLESFEHEGSTVMMAPNTGFYATPGLGKQEVRMAYVLEREEIEKAVACLRAALSAYPGTVK